METINIDMNKAGIKEIKQIAGFFIQKKVAAYPTDTIYGLGGIATEKKVAERILRMKKRNRNKGFIILVGSINMAKRYAHIGKKQERYLKKIWPGSVTVILSGKSLLPKEVSMEESLAMRLPNNQFLIRLIRQIGVPLISTSLNISGKNQIEDPYRVESDFKSEKPDLLVYAGKLTSSPSRIIDIRDLGKVRVLRE